MSIVLTCLLCAVSGVFLDMNLFHLLNFSRSIRHPAVRIWRMPKLASTIWGLIQLFCAALILLLVKYEFALSAYTLCLFLGFGSWAIFLAALEERDDRREASGRESPPMP
jgi:hypothetical protein